MNKALQVLYKSKANCEQQITSVENAISDVEKNLTVLKSDLKLHKEIQSDLQKAIDKLEGKSASKSKKTIT